MLSMPEAIDLGHIGAVGQGQRQNAIPGERDFGVFGRQGRLDEQAGDRRDDHRRQLRKRQAEADQIEVHDRGHAAEHVAIDDGQSPDRQAGGFLQVFPFGIFANRLFEIRVNGFIQPNTPLSTSFRNK